MGFRQPLVLRIPKAVKIGIGWIGCQRPETQRLLRLDTQPFQRFNRVIDWNEIRPDEQGRIAWREIAGQRQLVLAMLQVSGRR